MNCIYCKNLITDENSSEEHVFPKSFGCPDHWVLDCVCRRRCNETFGGSIDRWLAGDSLEGIKRMQRLGSRSGQRIRPKRLKLHILKEDRYGDFQGAIVWIDFSRTDNVTIPPQIGLRNEKGEREFFADEELDVPEIRKRIDSLSKKGVIVLAPSKEKNGEMVQLLLAKGILEQYNPKDEGFGMPEGAVENNRIMIEANADIDADIQRAIAKIAFNYLAKIQGYEYALSENFDEIRSFINGELRKPLVILSNDPILADEGRNWRRFNGHLFVFERNGDRLISQISLFNGITYRVLLSRNIGPLVYSLGSGHAFDVETLELKELFGTSLIHVPRITFPNFL